MDSFHTLPIGSIYSRSVQDTLGYLDTVQILPIPVKAMISSSETGSYIKGISRTYDITEDSQATIAFAILEIVIGGKTFNQLPAILSTELGLPADKAQKMAAEIEKDLFGPVRSELDQFLQQQKLASNPSTENTRPAKPVPAIVSAHQGVPNLLNLKELSAGKQQPRLSARSQTALPQKPTPPPIPRTAPSPKPPVSPIKPLYFT